MIGRTLGGYRIVEQVGMGGMATVYKAYDASTDRYVALKTLPEQYSKDPQFVERFRREAKAIAKLEHLHILPLFAYGEDEGIAYLAMRYLPAGTLSNHIKQKGQMPLEEAGRLLSQIASALDHAHVNGVLHRDIKPSNVLIDKDANAYLTDFGIARMVEGTLDLTGDAILGTPQYMSPEQCQGRKDLTPASDQYSLGVVLYEMISGRVPFQAETPLAVIIMQINGSELPPPSTLRPDLPEAAEMVILKALARNPADRYPSCEALARAFNQAVEEQSSTAATRSAQPANAMAQTPASATASTQTDDERTVVQVDTPARPRLSPTLIAGAAAAGIIIIGGLALLVGRPPAVAITTTPLPEQTQLALLPTATAIPLTVTPLPSATTVPPSATPLPPPTATVVKATTAPETSSALPTVVSILLAEGDTQAAIDHLMQAMTITPKDASLYVLRGKAYMQDGNIEAALPDFTQAITLSPELADAYIQRAAAYRDQNNLAAAVKDLTEAIKLQPNRADLYAMRGEFYRDSEDYDNALTDLGKAIALDPKNPKWYVARATANEWHGDLDSAITDLNKAIELNPQFADYYTQRGQDQRWREQYDLALADFMRARALDPNNAAAYWGPVETYLAVLDSGSSMTHYDLDMALADATRAIEMSPDNDSLLFDRGRIHRFRDEPDDAISDFTQAIKLYDQSAAVYIHRGDAYTNTGHFDLAKADFDRAIQLDPNSIDAYQGRIETYIEAVDQDKPLKDYDLNTALADANAALILDNGNAVSFLLRGKVYGRQGDTEKALADLNQTVDMESGMAWGYQERGTIYGLMGNTDAAIADFQKAIELDSNDPWYYVGLGDVLYDAGRHPEALAAYQAYVKQAGEAAVEYVRERIAELEKKS